jgi:hypothetical protein
MPSVTSVGSKDIPHREYIASAAFNNSIFNYTTSQNSNFQTVGSLTINPAATSGNCAAGTILRENGKKLYAGVHPNLSDPTTNRTYTYLVGVYCTLSPYIKGFIDPNSPLFAIFNTDKTSHLNIGSEAVDGATGLQDNGAPVYTSGNITSTAGNIVATAGSVTAGGQIRSSTVTPLVVATNATTLNVSAGQLFTLAVNGTTGAVTISISNPVAGAQVYLIITHTAGDTNARVITFGTNIRGLGTLTTGASGGEVYTINFICDGTALYELARTAAETDTT